MAMASPKPKQSPRDTRTAVQNTGNMPPKTPASMKKGGSMKKGMKKMGGRNC
jgi:hypothetical protein